jgi:hypothetical protein
MMGWSTDKRYIYNKMEMYRIAAQTARALGALKLARYNFQRAQYWAAKL